MLLRRKHTPTCSPPTHTPPHTSHAESSPKHNKVKKAKGEKKKMQSRILFDGHRTDDVDANPDDDVIVHHPSLL